MYFKPHLIEKMLRNEKTMTRRICKPGDDCRRVPLADGVGEIDLVVHKGRVKWELGRDYAVCPGRGKRATWYYPGKEPVIMLDDRQGNGTPYSDASLRTAGYVQLRIRIMAIRRERACDISEADAVAEGFANRQAFLDGWDLINGKGKREAEVWALTFENIGTIPPEVLK